MSDVVVKVVGVSKRYRLGIVGVKTMFEDVKKYLNKYFKRIDILQDEGEVNDRTITSTYSNYVWSLKDVNFEIEKGDVVGIIGRNGAGKSTLLKILSRITSPTEGEIKIKGKIASLLEVGTGFHPELTGRENIYLNGSILGMTKAEINAKLHDIIEFAEVQRYIDTPVKRYSSGMYVRLAFSIAAHLEPDILIVDEVLAVGDASFQKKCIDKMKEISQKDARTILFVSHSMASIQSLCSKIILLNNGGVEYVGNVDEGVERYLAKYKSEIIDYSNIENSLRREGNLKVVFSSLTFQTPNGVDIDSILSGQDLVFVFKLKINSKNINKIDVGFSIHDSNHQGICNNYSSYQNVFFENPESDYIIVKAVISKLFLVPGKYIIQGRIIVDDEESDFCFEDLGEIKVSMGDFYGSGVVGQTNWGNVLLKAKWS